MSKLIVVESPTKAKTISRFLGKDFKIESSFGHIRDLPQSKMGIDLEHGFVPEYVIPAKARARVAALKKLLKSAAEVILATDEDREGEAIAWHLTQALDLPSSPPSSSRGKGSRERVVSRIVFHEVTKQAIEEALKTPRDLDMNLVNAQQARRILDRLVGYELSPFLWKKIKRGLSAGRVQSVALRLIAEREREIKKFKTREYWTVEARLKKSEDPDTQIFTAKLIQTADQPLKKFDLADKTQADEIIRALEGAKYQIAEIKQKEARRFPAPPFTTSTLQQEASRKLGLSAKQTMMLAQNLYETGYITYMRTDSVNLAQAALTQAQEVIREKYGKEYILPKPRIYKTKTKGAQEAHEAIRPTDLTQDPQILEGTLEKREAQLYDLIWKRTVACQMPEAIFDQTTVDIEAHKNFPPLERGRRKGEVDLSRPARGGGRATLPSSGERNKENYLFRSTGQVLKFDGFIKAYIEGRDEEKNEEELQEGELPKLQQSENLDLKALEGKQHFTEPPPRYTDATLVKTLEEYGIGRPSTYAPTIATILERGYVERLERKFHPTEIGLVVNDLLVENFPKIVDYEFTAQMEQKLDEIAEGKHEWQPVIKTFYDPFKKLLEEKKVTVKKQVEKTNIPCPECGKFMVKRFGRFGQFLACSDFPKCKGTKPLPEEEAKRKQLEAKTAGRKCPECQTGDLVVRQSKFGYFFGCSRYPECKYIEKMQNTTGLKCPKCHAGEIIVKRTRKGRTFWGCNKYPACDYATWENPAATAPSSSPPLERVE